VIGLLESILCVLLQIPYFVMWAIISAVNAIILALGTLLEGLAAVLPDFPTLPTMPGPVATVLGWINWVFPVATVVTILLWAAVIYLAWFGISIALRWGKVLRD